MTGACACGRTTRPLVFSTEGRAMRHHEGWGMMDRHQVLCGHRFQDGRGLTMGTHLHAGKVTCPKCVAIMDACVESGAARIDEHGLAQCLSIAGVRAELVKAGVVPPPRP